MRDTSNARSLVCMLGAWHPARAPASAASARAARARRAAAVQRAGSGAPGAHFRARRIAGRQARRLYPAHHRHGRQQGTHRHLAARDPQAQRRGRAAHRSRGQLERARMERRRALHLLPVESQRLEAGVAAQPGERPGGEPTQVTNLPLDVGSFRVSPEGRSHVRERRGVTGTARRSPAPSSGWTRPRTRRQHGVLYDQIFVRHWDTWSDGRRSQLFSIALDAIGHRERRRRSISPPGSTATCRASPSAAARTTRQPGRSASGILDARRCRWASPGRPISTSTSCPPRAARRAT